MPSLCTPFNINKSTNLQTAQVAQLQRIISYHGDLQEESHHTEKKSCASFFLNML